MDAKKGSRAINYVREYGFYYLQSRYYNPEVGRFLNADVFTSTGQGLLGNNMFAYCNGSPINFQDDEGTRMEYFSFDSGAPVAFPSPSAVSQTSNSGGNSGSFTRKIKSVISNTDEQTAIDAKYFSFYKGVPVVKLPIGTDAFSFGIIFLGNDVGKRSDAIETIRHEYGHTMHFLMAGPESYTVNAFLPSVMNYWLDTHEYGEYYSQPYEYIADILGQVNRVDVTTNQPYQYSSAVREWAGLYFMYTCLF